MFAKISGRNVKTFKPQKKASTPRQEQLAVQMQATLGAGADLRAAVTLPPGTDVNEWLAMNTFDCYNEVSLLYGTVIECCTSKSCPKMSAGAAFEYLWQDPPKYSKPTKVTAPQYVDLLMTWVQDQLEDEVLFPQNVGQPFPRDFMHIVKNIFKRLFRVYAHLYHSHFEDIKNMGAEPHLNTCFKHLIFLIKEFDLVASKELAPLQSLIDQVEQVPAL